MGNRASLTHTGGTPSRGPVGYLGAICMMVLRQLRRARLANGGRVHTNRFEFLRDRSHVRQEAKRT